MDEIVLRALAKWPDVPAVYGWLSLDRRGNWRIKGERITNPMIAAFIGRNYGRDARGCWFFQNGPQRVYVALDYTPFVLRVKGGDDDALALETHTAVGVAALKGAWLDEAGALLLETEPGVALVHDRDLARLLPQFIDANGNPLAEPVLDELMELLQRGRPAPLWLKYRESCVRVEPIAASEVPARFGFVAQPAPPAGEERCERRN
ncbi:MAG TPA: DUF2946 family protein [Burkholderiales bacterium]|nr:DUF2946 family protein [Burkholderiales bacterium]